jgi:hypothetical protein
VCCSFYDKLKQKHLGAGKLNVLSSFEGKAEKRENFPFLLPRGHFKFQLLVLAPTNWDI